MNEQTLQAIKDLADKLKVPASCLWEAFIREARVEAITDTIILAVTILAGYILYLWAKAILRRDDWDTPEWMGIGIGAIAVFIVFIALFSSVVTEWCNPEYFAVHRILTSISGK